ncbi:MAG: Ig-like domain-containing protein, partial [bacterium]
MFLIIGFILSNTIIALADVPTTVLTPKGTPVVAEIRTWELDPSEIEYWRQSVAKYFPEAILISSASRKYNCHSYAWHSQAASNNIWINRPEQKKYWQDGSYCWVATAEGTPSNVPNDARVSYDGDDHSAIKYSNTHFISKWGEGPVMLHTPYHCPDVYLSGGLQLSYYSRDTSPPPDTTPPDISITNPSENQVINTSNVVISGSVRDLGQNASGIKTASLNVGGGIHILSEGNFSVKVSLSDGKHTAIVNAKDKAGNTSSKERHFVVDTQPPKTEINGVITNQKKIITIKRTTIIYTDCQGNEKRRETIEEKSETIEKGKASFTWEGEDNLTTSNMLKFSYRLSPSAFGGFSYSKSVEYKGLSFGNYLFEVKAI